MTDNSNASRDANVRWLVAGALAGLLAVGIGMLQRSTGNGNLPPGYVASVNNRLISQDVFERALERLRVDSSNVIDGDDAAWVLQRLIEEELLVQRGLELGMAESEMDVRGAIVQSLVASITAEADAANPDDESLRKFFDANAERFSYSAAVAVDAWSAGNEVAARKFMDELHTGIEDSAAVQRLREVPLGPLPLNKLRDYLGAGITAAVAMMPAGSSAVFARQGRWLIVRVVSKQDAVLADFEHSRTQVLLDYRRNRADQLLRDYLDMLTQQADVVVSQP